MEKQFAVFYAGFGGEDPQTKIIKAVSEVQAVGQLLNENGWEVSLDHETLDGFYSRDGVSDVFFAAIEIPCK